MQWIKVIRQHLRVHSVFERDISLFNLDVSLLPVSCNELRQELNFSQTYKKFLSLSLFWRQISLFLSSELFWPIWSLKKFKPPTKANSPQDSHLPHCLPVVIRAEKKDGNLKGDKKQIQNKYATNNKYQGKNIFYTFMNSRSILSFKTPRDSHSEGTEMICFISPSPTGFKSSVCKHNFMVEIFIRNFNPVRPLERHIKIYIFLLRLSRTLHIFMCTRTFHRNKIGIFFPSLFFTGLRDASSFFPPQLLRSEATAGEKEIILRRR